MSNTDRSENADEFDSVEDVQKAVKETADMLNFEVERFVTTLEAIAAKGPSSETTEEGLNFIKDEFFKGFVGMGMQPASANEMKDVILENIDFLMHNATDKDIATFNETRRNMKEERKLMKMREDIAQRDETESDDELDEALFNDFQYASKKEIEGIYATAYKFYNSGRYADATNLFKLLVRLNARDHRYHFGLASCLMMTENYEEAVSGFVFSHHLKQDQPLALFFLAKCNIKLEHLQEAKTGFTEAMKLMGDHPEFSEYVKHANNMIELIDKKLAQ